MKTFIQKRKVVMKEEVQEMILEPNDLIEIQNITESNMNVRIVINYKIIKNK